MNTWTSFLQKFIATRAGDESTNLQGSTKDSGTGPIFASHFNLSFISLNMYNRRKVTQPMYIHSSALFFLLLLLAGNIQAQKQNTQQDSLPPRFEGSMEFEFRTIIIDQKTRQNMEKSFEAVTQAATSEENQKALQKLQEAMKQPGMQEHMEANPEMKKLMDNQAKTMRQQQQGASAALDQAYTSELTVWVKDSSWKTQAFGKHFTPKINNLSTLFVGEKHKNYNLDLKEKQYWEIKPAVDSADLVGTITRVRGDSVIQDFLCQKYEFVMDSGGQNMTTGYMWVTQELHALSDYWAHIPNMPFFTQVDGFPLHIFLQKEDYKGQMVDVFSLKKVVKETLPAKDFKMPKGYSATEANE